METKRWKESWRAFPREEYTVQLNPNCKKHYLCLESGTQVDEREGMQVYWVTDGTSGEGYFCQEKACHRTLAEKARGKKGSAGQCWVCGGDFWECLCYYGMEKDGGHSAKSPTTSERKSIKTARERAEGFKGDGVLGDGFSVGGSEIPRSAPGEERGDGGRLLQELDAASERGTVAPTEENNP